MMYTPVPNSLIFAELSESPVPQRKQVTYHGCLLEVSKAPEGWKIERNLSTDPESFLKPDISIGSVIKDLL